MKRKILCILLLCVMIINLTSCGNNNGDIRLTKQTNINDVVSKFNIERELPDIQFSNNDYISFLDYIDYENIECPYSDLFALQDAINEKNSRIFSVNEHSYDFLNGTTIVDSNKLFDVVKRNNKDTLKEGVEKNFYDELSDSKLKECCEIIAKTINWGINNVDSLDLNELSCMLGNLKILDGNSMNLGSFNDKKIILNITPSMIKQKQKQSGVSNMYELTICHETMHMMQCHCLDVKCGNEDYFIGVSYAFENLKINPLKNRWLYEASAELCAAQMFGIEPTMYKYMIDNLETISLATILNDTVKAGQLEKISFTKNPEKLYSQLEFSDAIDAMNFIYAVELLREKPEEFKEIYESQYGLLDIDYDEFLKVTYNPYFVEVTSKLLYKNIALQLSRNKMNLNDVFYIISLYELDLLKDIPLDNPTVKEKYINIYQHYIDMQQTFFEYIQGSTDIDVVNAFMQYKINYENGSVYAAATFEWLDADKREYLINRNRAMYDKAHQCIMSY